MGESEHFKEIENKFSDWLCDSKVIDYFKELFPSEQIIEEKLDSGRVTYKAFSPFCNSVSKEPQMYMFDECFFDFETGQRGTTVEFLYELLYHNSDMSIGEKIRYVSEKTGIDIIKTVRKFPKYSINELVDELVSIRHQFSYVIPDKEISHFTKLGINSCLLSDGTWINPDTKKTENPIEYYLKNFNDFEPGFRSEILSYMPSIKKAIEAQSSSSPSTNNQLYK
jgi:hypothetical protein